MSKPVCGAMLAAILFGLVGSHPALAQPGRGNASPFRSGGPLQLRAGNVPLELIVVADGLVGPWDIEFLPDGAILVNEMNGRMRIIRDGELRPDAVWQSPSPAGNDVLHGLAVHPDFERNGLIYASYTKAKPDDPSLLTTALSRGRLVGDRLVDRDSLCCGAVDDNHIRMRAQSLADHVGKVLRLSDAGGVPADNPFVGIPDARDEIFTYGNRNPYGLEFHPETGDLWEIEIGPMGGDEINILVPGGNYGWPLVSMGRNYSGTLVSEQPWYREGMINPRVFWVPAISPSSLEFYTGDAFPEWRGSLFVTALSGQHLERLSFGQRSQAEGRQELLGELGLRFRDVEQGPDAYLYLATEVRYGSGNPDGAVIRLQPAGR